MNRIPRAAIRLPVGVRDFLPRAAARRRAIAGRLLEEFERWGFERIITPLYECADVLERGLGDDAREAAIRFVEPASGEVVALRPDITPQIARIAATRFGDIDGPVRLCYEGAVTRLDGARGQREILQAGIELIGAGSPAGDAEAIAVAAAALEATRVSERRLDIGHVAVAAWSLGMVDNDEQRAAIHAALQKKDRAGVHIAAKGLSADLRRVLEELPWLFGKPSDVLSRARALPLPQAVLSALGDVDDVLDHCAGLIASDLLATVTIDLGDVRGFDYYTGLRFSGYVAGVGSAVLRGGRYDELLGRYGRDCAATGFAVDIEAIAHAQSANDVEPPPRTAAVLVVAPGNARLASKVAAALRQLGHRAASDLAPARQQDSVVDYATSVGFDRVLWLDKSPSTMWPGGQSKSVEAKAVELAAGGEATQLERVLDMRRD